MNDQKRRFRPRPQRNGFRPRNNGSMTNPFNVEKTVQKYQQLAKDALTSGDPVLHENYLQHAEHFSRRLSELNTKPKEQQTSSIKPKEQQIEKTSLAEKLNKQSLEKKEVI